MSLVHHDPPPPKKRGAKNYSSEVKATFENLFHIYLAGVQVLLIGNMGLYDYRPYVKKISNDRQIMYDCEKEYRLDPGRDQSPFVLRRCVGTKPNNIM